MEKISSVLFRQKPKKRVNQFYELCKFFSEIWNGVPNAKKFAPNRFMRDCKANRRAYELAQLDYQELMAMYPKHDPVERARLLFGQLKKRKHQLNQ